MVISIIYGRFILNFVSYNRIGIISYISCQNRKRSHTTYAFLSGGYRGIDLSSIYSPTSLISYCDQPY